MTLLFVIYTLCAIDSKNETRLNTPSQALFSANTWGAALVSKVSLQQLHVNDYC